MMGIPLPRSGSGGFFIINWGVSLTGKTRLIATTCNVARVAAFASSNLVLSTINPNNKTSYDWSIKLQSTINGVGN